MQQIKKQQNTTRSRKTITIGLQGELHPLVIPKGNGFSVMSFNQIRYQRNKERFQRYYKKNKQKILLQVKEKQKEYKKRDHGLYRTYLSMSSRCNYKSHTFYTRYGGRGIKCLWKNYKEFKKDMYDSYIKHFKVYGRRDTTLDRIDNDGNYCKENCRWATQKEQKNNTMRSVFLTFNNQTMTMGEWGKKLGIHKSTLKYRLKRGWSVERALSTLSTQL
jgi:hypothetical protein